jgi:hypothetical protein
MGLYSPRSILALYMDALVRLLLRLWRRRRCRR